MLKQLTICAALLGLATAPVAAQQVEAVLQRMQVKGADFDIVLAMPKSPPQRLDSLDMSPDALVMHLAGGELVVSFEDAREMLKAAETLRSSDSSSHWVRKVGERRTPLAVYVVPKAE